MNKKLLSLVVVLVMVFTMVPLVSEEAHVHAADNITCPVCNGNGTFDCILGCNNGSWTIGSENFDCPLCNGGVETCWQCYGNGTISHSDSIRWHNDCTECDFGYLSHDDCEECTGTLICTYCGGDGLDHTCRQCYTPGDGYDGGDGLCANCEGSGECPVCNDADGFCPDCHGWGGYNWGCDICEGIGSCQTCAGQGHAGLCGVCMGDGFCPYCNYGLIEGTPVDAEPCGYCGGSAICQANNCDTCLGMGYINIEKYAIFYDLNGGSGVAPVDTNYYSNDDAVFFSNETPTRAGFTFLGWSTNKDATSVDPEIEYTSVNNSALTIYAIWEEETLPDVSITAPAILTKEYDGTPIDGESDAEAGATIQYQTKTSPTGDYSSASETIPGFTDVGKLYVKATAEKTGYSPKSIEYTLEVTKRAITLESASSSKEYDGTPLTNSTVTVVEGSWVGTDGATYTVDGSQTNIGMSPNTFEYTLKPGTKTGNYDITLSYGALTVTPIKIVMKSASDSKVYDGTALTNYNVDIIEGSFMEGDGASYNVTGSQTEVGTSFNTFTCMLNQGTEASYYNITLSCGSLTVTSNTPTPTPSYDGGDEVVVKKEQKVNPFEDVALDDKNFEAIMWAYEKGITLGVDATHFNPAGTATRAQMVTFLWRLAGKPEAKSSATFIDVMEDYYTQALNWAVEKGITLGTGDNKFDPNGEVTKSQLALFIERLNGKKLEGGDEACTREEIVKELYELEGK